MGRLGGRKQAYAAVAALAVVVLVVHLSFARSRKRHHLRSTRERYGELGFDLDKIWARPGAASAEEEILMTLDGLEDLVARYHAPGAAVAGGDKDAAIESGIAVMQREEWDQEREWEFEIKKGAMAATEDMRGTMAASETSYGATQEAMAFRSLRELLDTSHLFTGREQEPDGTVPMLEVRPMPGVEVPISYCTALGPREMYDCLHSVGHTLADDFSAVPEECLTASLGNSCLSGFIEHWLELYGDISGPTTTPAEKAVRVTRICNQMPGFSVGACLHGAAHFLYEESGSELEAAIDVCTHMEAGHRVTCASGVYKRGATPYGTEEGYIASPCRDADVHWECLRYAGFEGKSNGMKVNTVLGTCERLKREGAATHEVRACFLVLGDLLMFPSAADLTGAERQLVAAHFMADDAVAIALLFGGHRTLSHTPALRKDEEKFCRTKLRSYGLDTEDNIELCTLLLLLPEHCHYCQKIHALFYPPGGLPPPNR